ncbi:TlpA family protein disulfide reductase [Flavobacterium humi]|uniref:TlpA family protein disulfide reductase n=1 Tax=Flavobacterium humi TaxID=2562683 RepID=A0A4Z0LA05_9FLAO|nr:TlpA disulfide reductase family protein [Flavobacterium humi]TGD58039.1 TlpA family protein disulfide reductase [Flavobacterium humi]
MKKLLYLVSFVLLNISCSSAQTKFSAEALETKLANIEGTQVLFQDIIKKHKGKPVVIEVWASWCGDCVKNMPKLKELQAGNPNVDFVFLSCDKNTEAWKNGIAKHELAGDHYLVPEGMKGSFGKSIDLNWIPRYIIIDKKGKIALYKAIETDHEQVKSLLKSLQ